MAVTDGHLRTGADVLRALGRADGLLFLAGPDTGAGVISASGVIAAVALLSAAEGHGDVGTLAVAALLADRATLVAPLSALAGYAILRDGGRLRWGAPIGSRLSASDGQLAPSPATRTGRIITDA